MNQPQIPKGCEQWTNKQGITILRLHYSADPAKDAAWAEREKAKAVSDQWWRQEMEIDFGAALGALVFPTFTREATVVKSYRIPHEWTRWMAIDPHPRVPHAFLWMAVAPSGDHVYYREYWPSKAYGRLGDVPEDDELYQIDDYVETIRMLESSKVDIFSPGGFADNGKRNEKIFYRIMDPYGKAIAANRVHGKEEPETFWDRYRDLGIYTYSAKKDWHSGVDVVNKRLRPRRIVTEQEERVQSQIVIFDTLPELILELQTNRYPPLTPEQAAKRDPGDTPLPKRKHLTDLLRYIEIDDPRYTVPRVKPESVRPLTDGIGY